MTTKDNDKTIPLIIDWFQVEHSTTVLLNFVMRCINPFMPYGISHRYIWTSPFPFPLCGIFHFHFHSNSIEHSTSKQWRSWSDAAFYGVKSGSALLSMSHKNDTRLIWVKSWDKIVKAFPGYSMCMCMPKLSEHFVCFYWLILTRLTEEW